MKRRLLCAALLLAAAPSPAFCASLSVSKTTTVVADQVNTVNPKALPGATIDYTLTVTNPVANLLTPVGQVVITDVIASNVKLSVADLSGAGAGPVEFVDGGLLGLGLTSSNLTYSYGGLTSTTDKLEFYDGTSWTYQPVSAAGYDANVRAVRVTLTGTQATGGSFRLRYRVQVK